MLNILSLLSSLFKFLEGFMGWFRERQMKEDAKIVVGAEVATAEAEATREAAVIISEHREPSDAGKRLSNGTF